MSFAHLSKEWERVETLTDIVTDARKHQTLSDERLNHLKVLQGDVMQARENGAWEQIASTPMSYLEYDVLACSMAPDISPRVAWMYQTLNGRKEKPYPTLHFLQELLSLDPAEAPALYEAVNENSPLRKDRLIHTKGEGPFTTIQPGPGITARLLGASFTPPPPPGTTLVVQKAGWKDLILPDSLVERLHEFLAYLTNRHKIENEWGGLSYGGPVALFSGPSGTGKTFSASVLATELDWPLYRVDLGRLVSKYIGETEKNLNALFDSAHGVDMILQFDEADALFSKRGEVKEARDRYANMEVSHLLSRIENHHGPCILTTNLRDQMDTAFARRFQIVIDFPRPDFAARRALWQQHLPRRAPLDTSVDFDVIAEGAKISGGSIRNAALHAAIMAARADTPIHLRHIAIAIWRELGKEGRPVSRSELGAMTELIDEAAL